MPIIQKSDLPDDIQSNPQADLWVDGVNGQAARVAPCLTEPTSADWAAESAYAVGDKAELESGGYLQVTGAGTSGATAPTSPAAVGETVVDGSVTWKLIAPTSDQIAEARMILIGAVQRWAEAGTGAVQQQMAGPFSILKDTSRPRAGYRLWPSEIEQLQDICGGSVNSISAIDTVADGPVHADICSANRYVDSSGTVVFGGAYCTCGADIAGSPLYEV